MELQFRIENPGEEEAVSRVVCAAFGDQLTASLVDALRGSSAWRDLSFVATTNNGIIGHVSYTRGWIDAPSRLVEVLILSPMSVVPEWQRKGIGSRLIKESLAVLCHRHEPLVFLEGDPRFYSTVGFRRASEAGFIAPSLRIPDPAFQYFPLPSYEPWMTGQLVYPDVFWAMDFVGLRP